MSKPVSRLVPETRQAVSVLVVDEERSLLESCGSLLRNHGYEVTVASRGDDAQRLLRSKSFDILVVNQHLPRVSGLDVLQSGLESRPEMIAIVMTANPSVESSVSVLKAGAWDYLPKPFSATHFEVLVGRAAHAVLGSRVSSASQPQSFGDFSAAPGVPLYGASDALRTVISLAERVARTDASVFITGESGTGKEVVAQFIHHNSRRSDKPLVPVNCAAIPESLLESEMFGYVEGAFTGASRSKEGLLEAANGGTLFLDEITEMPLTTQAKLLRVVQDGVLRRVGSTTTDAVVDVRFIAATNRNPLEAIQDAKLRKDLHYRLRVVPIEIPPLRERPMDVPVLAREFLAEFWSKHRDPASELPSFSEECLAAMKRASWPGNVRELRNVVEHAVVFAEPGQSIDPEALQFLDEVPASSAPSGSGVRDEVMSLDYHSARDLVLSSFEVEYLARLIKSAEGNVSDAARMAGVDRTTLYRLMEKHGIRKKTRNA